MNFRVIDHLGLSPFEIEEAYQSTGILGARLPSTLRTDAVKAAVENNLLTMLENHSDYHNNVFNFIAKREGMQLMALEKSDWRKMLQKERHDRGVHRRVSYKSGDLVMLYDHRNANKKLAGAFRGPFVIQGIAGTYGMSYKLRQINGKVIPRSFYDDHLKPFTMRSDYLITGDEEDFPKHQNIRAGRAKYNISRALQRGDGAWSNTIKS